MKPCLQNMKNLSWLVASTMCADAFWWPRVATKSMRAATAIMTPRRMKLTVTPSKKWCALYATSASPCLKHVLMMHVALNSPPIFAPCATFLMIALREIITTVINAAFVA